jgi:mono/diheme cytochrome c family protein
LALFWTVNRTGRLAFDRETSNLENWFFDLSNRNARQNSPIENPKVAAGAKLFALNCAHCHGIDASGDEGPDLHKVAKTDERIKSTILNGVKGEMPAFGKKLTDDDARTLVTFIRSLSAK